MGLTLVTDATLEPVTRDQAKKQLELAITPTTHNAQIDSYIKRARLATERLTRRAWINQTWRLALQRFPYESEYDATFRCIHLPRPPLVSVTSVTYVDTDEATQTLATSEYNVRTNSKPGLVALAPTKTWPTTSTEEPEAVIVTYVAGHGTGRATVPEEAKQAILALVDYWWNNRDKSDVPGFVRDLLDSLHCGMKYGTYGVTA